GTRQICPGCASKPASASQRREKAEARRSHCGSALLVTSVSARVRTSAWRRKGDVIARAFYSSSWLRGRFSRPRSRFPDRPSRLAARDLARPVVWQPPARDDRQERHRRQDHEASPERLEARLGVDADGLGDLLRSRLAAGEALLEPLVAQEVDVVEI